MNTFLSNDLYDPAGNKKTFPNARIVINSRQDLNKFIDYMEANETLTYPTNFEYQISEEVRGDTSFYTLAIKLVKQVHHRIKSIKGT